MDYIFELRVPVVCTVSFGRNREVQIRCVPNDLLCIHVPPEIELTHFIHLSPSIEPSMFLDERKEVCR